MVDKSISIDLPYPANSGSASVTMMILSLVIAFNGNTFAVLPIISTGYVRFGLVVLSFCIVT